MKRLLTLALGVALTGCFSPHTVATRQFVLTAAPITGGGASTNLRLGIRVVGMPEYLLGSSLVVRQSANEIRPLDTALWAERLDRGFERVLAANLSTMTMAGQVRHGAWRADDVTYELHVSVDRFDVDQNGQGNLIAGWRITSPGGGKIFKSGTVQLTKTGNPPAEDPKNLVTTLNELTTDFSHMLAQALKDIPSP